MHSFSTPPPTHKGVVGHALSYVPVSPLAMTGTVHTPFLCSVDLRGRDETGRQHYLSSAVSACVHDTALYHCVHCVLSLVRTPPTPLPPIPPLLHLPPPPLPFSHGHTEDHINEGGGRLRQRTTLTELVQDNSLAL